MEYVVIIEDGEADTMEFTFDCASVAMGFATIAKRHSDTDAMVTIEVLKGDEEDED